MSPLFLPFVPKVGVPFVESGCPLCTLFLFWVRDADDEVVVSHWVLGKLQANTHFEPIRRNMPTHTNLQVYYGDIHNHCGISYGHGSLSDALANAKQRLDFVSITGHAHWPDIPADLSQPTVDYHLRGFERLKHVWPEMLETLKAENEEGRFVIFPAFEVHFTASGDRNVVYKDLTGEILYPANLEDLHRQLSELRARGIETLAQPHHIGYRQGTRGIDWETHDPEFAPFVELISMHGCSETNEGTRPFLHVMGPSDWQSTIQYGLERGHIFGVTGGTDHHSGHPGSYGHGLTGVWATSCARDAIWDALYSRRSYALTGDRIGLQFSINDAPMGSVIESSDTASIAVDVSGGGSIDCVDIIKNNQLRRRFSQYEFEIPMTADRVRTKLHLELGWGLREVESTWHVEFGIREGQVIDVEPRFRGRQVVSPLDEDSDAGTHSAWVESSDDQSVNFVAAGQGNPNNYTPNMQGVCLEVEAPRTAVVYAIVNGTTFQWSLQELLHGARSASLGALEHPSIRIHRAPEPRELNWSCSLNDSANEGDVYYIRVRQTNDQWAWSSPIFVR